MLLFQHRVCLSRFVFVYLMTHFLCSTAYGHCKRKIPAQWVCDSMDESKGRFASWGWVIFLLLRTPEKTLSHWRVGRACADSLKQFVGKLLLCSLKLSWRHRAVLILPDLWVTQNLAGKIPSESRHGACQFLLCQPGQESNREIFEINAGLTIAHRLPECCLWRCPSLRCQMMQISF